MLSKVIIHGKVDNLDGLKENIMLGNLMLAGTRLTGDEEVIKIGEEYHRNEY